MQTRLAVENDVVHLERIIQYAYRGGKATGSWTNEYSLVKGPRITIEQLHGILKNEDQALLVAEIEENGSKMLAGCICVDNLKNGQAYLGMLAIDPDLQSKGVGKQLFAAAEEHATKVFGCHTARGSVLSPRDELLAWYRRLGYEENGETEPFLKPESGVTALVDNLHFRVIVKKLLVAGFLLAAMMCCLPTLAVDGIGSVDDFVLHDKQRNKDLHMRITYPTEEGKFPVIIFSHGAGGSKDGYRYLISYWVKNGFVCIQPSHADAITNTANKEQLFQTLMSTLRVLPTDYSGWANRVADIKLILSSLQSIQTSIPAVMDTSHVGLGGHSYGAFTSMLLGGATVPKIASAKVKNPYDGRVAAILVISPQGIKHRPRDFGFDNKFSWKGLHGPAMFMTGSLDQTGWTMPKDRRAPYLDSPAGNKYLVDIKGANHLTFAGVGQREDASKSKGPIVGKRIANRIQKRKEQLGALTTTGRLAKFFGPMESGDHQKMLDAIELVSTDFWDAYLKDLESDKQALQSEAVEKDNPLIQIESK
ncbi:MAG: GNAT family N-acetyltransferase [Candidatus Obscuribacterales bacterium]|nr:GNAT family N-acetyltransferase [Candidatus Obscuribacterales bacterium]